MMGYSCFVLGKIPLSIKYYQSALELNESENQKGEVVNVCKELSNIYVSLGDYPVALSYIEKASQYLDDEDSRGELMVLLVTGEILILKQD